MYDDTSAVGATRTRRPSARSTIASAIGPNGDTGQRPITTRVPLVVPNPVISPTKRSLVATRPVNSWRRRVGRVPETFFTVERRGDGSEWFPPTAHARGPWDPTACHGGPPTGLLVRALER